MDEVEKLRVLFPHWFQHNAEHADEFRRWAEEAGVARADLLAAADALEAANDHLRAALERLGGPSSRSTRSASA